MTRTVLITGASQGIGKATAQAFAAAGWSVVLAARGAEKLRQVAEETGGLPVATDVTDPASVANLFDNIRDQRGHLDAVFNNAGTNVPAKDVGEHSFDEWRHVLSVNLDGAFLIASGAFKMMKTQDPQGGRIINNGSISAHVPRYNSAPYSASKHAITGLTKSISLDGRAYRIACGQIDIGNAASDMTENMSKGVPQADGTLKAEPTMDVRLVANAVVQMAELPLEANVLCQTIMATTMPFVGRG